MSHVNHRRKAWHSRPQGRRSFASHSLLDSLYRESCHKLGHLTEAAVCDALGAMFGTGKLARRHLGPCGVWHTTTQLLQRA